MSYSNLNNKSAIYPCNGSTTEFNGDFYSVDQTYCKVILIDDATGGEVELTQGVDYTFVTAASAFPTDSWSIQTTTTYPAGKSIIIARDIPNTQEDSYAVNSSYYGPTHEVGFDKIYTKVGELNERLDRCIEAPISDPSFALDTAAYLAACQASELAAEAAKAAAETAAASIGSNVTTQYRILVAGGAATIDESAYIKTDNNGYFYVDDPASGDNMFRSIGTQVDLNSDNNSNFTFFLRSAGSNFLLYSNAVQDFLGVNTNTRPRAGSLMSVNGDLDVENSLVLPKEKTEGIQIDNATPGWAWKDLKGLIRVDNSATFPTLDPFSGNVRGYSFAALDEIDMMFHLPHDYMEGTDMHVHVHWSHNGTAISGNFNYTLSYIYAKGHDQGVFPASKSQAVSISTPNIATIPQYRHNLEEVQLSNSGGTGNFLDSSLLEPDGIILMNLEVTAIPTITGSATGDNRPYIFTVDIHYQSRNIGTKDKVPNFYT